MFIGSRVTDVYVLNIEFENDEKCLLSLKENIWLWHKRLSHASMDLL